MSKAKKDRIGETGRPWRLGKSSIQAQCLSYLNTRSRMIEFEKLVDLDSRNHYLDPCASLFSAKRRYSDDASRTFFPNLLV